MPHSLILWAWEEGACLALFVMFWGFWSLPVSKLLTLFLHFMELPTLPHPFNPITFSGRNLASRIESPGLPWWSVVKNLPASVGDVSSVPGWEDALEKEMATHSSVLA